MAKKKPAFIIAAHTVGLGIGRALNQKGVPVILLCYNDKEIGSYSKQMLTCISIPHPEKEEVKFLEALITKTKPFGKGALFPASDEAVVVIGKNWELLSKHFFISSVKSHIVEKFIEKKNTALIAQDYNVPSPKTIVPNNNDEVINYAKRIQFPCLIKPSQSHLFVDYFKKKMIPVYSAEELLDVYHQTVKAGLEVMLQEIIPGDDDTVVNYNAYFWNGEPLVEFTAQQIRSAPPNWGSPCVVMSKDIPEVIDSGRKILKAMNFNGFACTEFKRDSRDGLYKLIEVNGRHNLSTLLAVKCGINFPYLHYQHLIHNEIPKPLSFQKGIYWIDITRDFVYGLKALLIKKLNLKFLFRPYFNPHVFAIYNKKDTKPFFKRCLYIVNEFLIKVKHQISFQRRKKSLKPKK